VQFGLFDCFLNLLHICNKHLLLNLMRKIYFILLALTISTSAIAQLPQKMSYQSVIRNSSNQLVTSHAVGMRVSILLGSATGTAVYVETQTPTTNINGLVTIEIGGGTPVSGIFANIDWSTGTYYIKTETDPMGGTNYTITGTSQLLSVPYALYSKTSLSSADGVKLTGDQSISGSKTFSGTVTVSTPVNSTDAANKAYVDILKSQIDNIQVQIGIEDIDANLYKIVKIGTQMWMADNLKSTKYQNGDLIGTTSPATLDISGESTPKYQWAYDGNEINVGLYGRLYTWYAVTDSRGICPVGWHVPTDEDWTTLTTYLTNNGYGYEGSGNDIAKSMASKDGWNIDPTTGNVGNDQASNNKSGINLLPSGYRFNTGAFSMIGINSRMLSATEMNATWAFFRLLSYDSSTVLGGGIRKQSGCSVRCLRDY
jgi:uncharacterized protein (TIGR02145 family)